MVDCIYLIYTGPLIRERYLHLYIILIIIKNKKLRIVFDDNARLDTVGRPTDCHVKNLMFNPMVHNKVT